MALFTTRNLSNSRVLVKGEDSDGTTGSTVLNGAEWEHVKQHSDFANAEANFEEEVNNFFKPLLEAAEKMEAAKQPKAPDPASVVVLHEGTPGVEAVASETIHLSHDSIVLRLIEEGTFDRLVWVDGKLEVLEAEPEAPATETWVDRNAETSSHSG